MRLKLLGIRMPPESANRSTLSLVAMKNYEGLVKEAIDSGQKGASYESGSIAARSA